MSQENRPPEPLAGFVTVNGLSLRYLDWGGAGAPIVIVHATGFLGYVYRPIAGALRSLGHVFSYDQRGHGESAQPPLDEIDWYRSADDLEGFITAMGFERVRAFGHSAGGTAIAAVAARRPELIERAVLVEPVLIDANDPRERPSELFERTLKRKRVFESLDAMYDNFADKPPFATWKREVLRDFCLHGTQEDADGRRLLRCPPEIEARIYQTARDFDGLGRLLSSTVPILVVFGERSDSPGIGFASRIADGAPHRQVRILPGASHFAPMEYPEEVAQIAAAFFQAG
ncbi:MAG TPA: alpha/beta hydrolase [Candidatus Binataceae bacterium]|nr:alpha/beta hydrolase [Candidatus Binataceae bacterium]